MFMRVTSAALAAAMLAGTASAATIQITSISGLWTGATGGNIVAGSLNTDTLLFGQNIGNGHSSYVFDPADVPAGPFSDGAVFALGEFTHNNVTIGLPSLTSATLDVEITGTITNGILSQGFTVSSIYEFDHNETPNERPCDPSGSTICPDIVTPTLNLGATESIVFNGLEYIITVSGFEGIGSFFLTEEGASNTATLNGSFIERPSEVPVPAALPLLLAGMGALGFAARRRKG